MKKKHISRNLEVNESLPTLDGSAPILSQSALSDWHYGNHKSDYCGCSWISIYNARYILGDPVEAVKIIEWMESRFLFNGLVFNGLLGAYPWAIGSYFKNHGYKVSYGFRKKTITRKAAAAKASVIFYLRRNFTAHFVAFQKYSEPEGSPALYHLFNERERNANDIRTLDDFYKASGGIFRVAVFIN